MVRYTVVYLVNVIVYGQSDTYKKYFWLNPKWKEVKLKYTKASWEMMNKRQSEMLQIFLILLIISNGYSMAVIALAIKFTFQWAQSRRKKEEIIFPKSRS